ncbi:hypothetical protein F5146DRAFT_1006551 [Armillaria mellea]|nr:hypothetical protein F5146DRAFT_1006551 [Armillaria mellea]
MYYLCNISLLVFNKNGQSDTVSETVLVVHGAVCWLDLPPLRARVKLNYHGIWITNVWMFSSRLFLNYMLYSPVTLVKETWQTSTQDFEELLIPQSIDSHRYLSEVAGDRYIYTDNNKIFYYKRKTLDSGKRDKIQVGHIIELHITFIAVPVKDGKKKVVSTLRSMTLLDGNLTELISPLRWPLQLRATSDCRQVWHRESGVFTMER